MGLGLGVYHLAVLKVGILLLIYRGNDTVEDRITFKTG